MNKKQDPIICHLKYTNFPCKDSQIESEEREKDIP
jgi:hypothetical protein